ncbi:hypothetical protein AB5J72_02110 [Streptomyces sp. CG1]|uniref:hypothetical protein n=1 Tax=Streptomyces sp. CG1 TaxID=1287523 RepID=UPI0034E1A995
MTVQPVPVTVMISSTRYVAVPGTAPAGAGVRTTRRPYSHTCRSARTTACSRCAYTSRPRLQTGRLTFPACVPSSRRGGTAGRGKYAVISGRVCSSVLDDAPLPTPDSQAARRLFGSFGFTRMDELWTYQQRRPPSPATWRMNPGTYCRYCRP